MAEDSKKSRNLLSNNLMNKKWKVRSVKTGGIYKAVYYEVLQVVFDEKNKRVLNWFVCGKCRLIIFRNLSISGTKGLHHHKCVAEYKEALKQEKKNDDDNDDEQPESESEDFTNVFECDSSGQNYLPEELIGKDDEDDQDEDDVQDEEDVEHEKSGEVEDGGEYENFDADENSDEETDVNISELAELLSKCNPTAKKDLAKIWPATLNGPEL